MSRDGWAWFAIVLVLLYVFPSLLFGFELALHGAEEPDLTISWYLALSGRTSTALAEVHQLILPLVSGMSVVTYSKVNSRLFWILIGVCLVSFVLVLAVEVLMGISEIQTNLGGLSYSDDQIELGSRLLSTQRSNLVLYLSVLLGLKTLSPPENKEEPENK